MPGATLGHEVITLTSWFHYGPGITIDQIVDILGYHLQTKLTPRGLIDDWRRPAEVLNGWYEQIGEEAKRSVLLHGDETSWRVNGVTYWLRCSAWVRSSSSGCLCLKRCRDFAFSTDWESDSHCWGSVSCCSPPSTSYTPWDLRFCSLPLRSSGPS